VNERREGFDGVAQLYDWIRPTYPLALMDELFSRLPERPDVIEVGPGTGQATGSLLEHGARVTAVELGANMAARLRQNFANDRLQILVATFEDVVFAPHAFDAVVSATAYHWVDESARLAKPAELLRPGGWLAIIDTVHVAAASDGGFFARSQSVYAKYEVSSDNYQLPSPDEVTGFLGADLSGSSLFQPPLIFRYRWDQACSAAGYAKLLRTYSSTQALSESDREAFIADMTQLVLDEFDGKVTRPLVFALTMAQRNTTGA
jgi:SAM-dependent methyltransferase